MGVQCAGPVMKSSAIPLGEFEPSGTWISKEDNFFVFSRDGKNWDRVAFAGSGSTNYDGDDDGSNYVLINSAVVANAYKSNNKSIPDFTQSEDDDDPPPNDDDEIGFCQWIAKGPAGWIARTSTQLRSSNDAINWVDLDDNIPANWQQIVSGRFIYSSVANLFMAFGSSFNAFTFEDNYYTSPSGTSNWTLRTFPVNFEGNGQGPSKDRFAENSSIAIMAMRTNGKVYSTINGINWTERLDIDAVYGFGLVSGAVWNPKLGAFYIVTSVSAPNNLLRSTDGITWAGVTSNNLASIVTSCEIIVDPVTGLMFANRAANDTGFQSGDSAVSLDGINWNPRWARSGNSMQHVPGKYGPLVSDVITITPDPININDSQTAPTTSFARLINRTDTTIDDQTVTGGISQIGHWPAAGEGLLSQHGREVRLDQLTGDALNFGTNALGVWTSAHLQKLWGYSIASGSLSGTFTFRVRDKITLVEDTNGGVPVTISAASV